MSQQSLFFFDVVCYVCWMLAGIFVVLIRLAPRWMQLKKKELSRFGFNGLAGFTCLVGLLIYFAIIYFSTFFLRGLWSSPSLTAFVMTLILCGVVLSVIARQTQQIRQDTEHSLHTATMSAPFRVWLFLYGLMVIFVQFVGLNEWFLQTHDRLLVIAGLSSSFVVISFFVWQSACAKGFVIERRVVEAMMIAWFCLMVLTVSAVLGVLSPWQTSSALLLWLLHGFCIDVLIPMVLFWFVMLGLSRAHNLSVENVLNVDES